MRKFDSYKYVGVTASARPCNCGGARNPKIIHLTTASMALVFFRGQFEYMRRHGFEVCVASSPGPELEEVAARQFRTFPVPMVRQISPLSDAVSLVRLCRLFLSMRPTIVHGSTPKAAMLAMVAATLVGVPIRFYNVFGLTIEMRQGLTRKLLWLIEWVTCRFAHRVIAGSRSVAEAILKEKLCSPGKITVLVGGSTNGVDTDERFNPDNVDPDEVKGLRVKLGVGETTVVVGFVGRIVGDKGIVELAQAWGQIRKTDADTCLILVGEVELADPVPSWVLERLRNDPSVILEGWVNNEEMPAYYRMMDLVVLPTYREGFPNVPLEAAAMGRPVIATTATGSRDAVLHEVTGMLVPPRDSASLAAAIQSYLDSPQRREQHGQAGRDRVVRHFRPEPIWEALFQEYVRALRSKGLPDPDWE